jgi:peptide/nickel transport system ATP-binding protein
LADLIEVRDLSIEFDNRGTMVPRSTGFRLALPRGSTVALVGESGSGKSVTAQAIMGILPKTAHITSGEILFAAPGSTRAPVDITRLDPDGAAIRAIRGRHISMIFQEPMVSLSPLHTIGDQVSEALFSTTKSDTAKACGRPKTCCGSWASPIRRALCATIRSSSPAGCVSAR